MTSLDKLEWPNFEGVPEEDPLISARPRGQKLARYVWWDGEVREADSLHVHYYANALHYGTAVFEGIRCYPTASGAALVRLQDHVERLISSARLYGMKLPFGADELARGALEVTRRNGMQNGYLRPLAYFGPGPIDLRPKKECPVRVFFAKGGVLHTNDVSSSIVPGITRDCILQIADELQVPIRIRPFTREDMLR